MNTKDKYISDIKKISKTIRAEKEYIFGSAMRGQDNEKSDIDIAFVVDSPNIDNLRNLVKELDLQLPVSTRKLNGMYSAAKPEVDGKHYHIVVLDKNENNAEFFKRSGATPLNL